MLRGTPSREVLKQGCDWPALGGKMDLGRRENRQRSGLIPGEQGAGRGTVQRWPGSGLQRGKGGPAQSFSTLLLLLSSQGSF